MQELQSISANFPRNVKEMAQRTRNKIARAAQAGLRVFPAKNTPSAAASGRKENSRVQEP
jgi:hypothetical protein